MTVETQPVTFDFPETDPGLSSVAAIVVTHRRPRLATQVVRSLLEEERLAPGQVFVIVNGEGGLDDPEIADSIHVIRLPRNLGPAGGFRTGMKAAAAVGSYEWYYLCEDDIGLFDLPVPRLRGLLAQLASFESQPRSLPVGAVVAYGRDLHPRSGHTTVHTVSDREGFDKVDAASWGASLIHAKVVAAGVVPRDDYFFGYEDFDFFYRLRRAGFLLLLDRRAAANVASQMSLAGRDSAFMGKRPLDVDEPWRAFYVSRNYFLLAREHGSPSWIAAHLCYSIRRLQLAVSRDERHAILRGVLAGVLGRRGEDRRFVRQQGEINNPSRGNPSGLASRELPGRVRFVLHVLPNDIARGGQVIARDLRDLLSRGPDRHEILTIFKSEPVLLEAEHRLPTRMGWRRTLGFDPLAYLRLRTALKKLHPDVVVAHGGEPLKYLALRKKRGMALIYFSFGIVTDPARRGLRHLFYRALMHRADIVAGISDETRDEALSLFGVPAERVSLLPNARDPEVYTPGDSDRAAGSPVRLIFVGHLTETKRPELFLALVSELRRRGKRVEGEIVGDGPLEAGIRRRANGTGVSVLGRRTDVPYLLRQADVFVFTSVPESEGMPGVLIEAGMSGLPVVATACPGVSTVLVPGETGYIVGVDDFPALAAAVELLVDDSELRDRMGRSARQRCVQEFSLDASGARWADTLGRLAPTGTLPTAGPYDPAPAV